MHFRATLTADWHGHHLSPRVRRWGQYALFRLGTRLRTSTYRIQMKIRSRVVAAIILQSAQRLTADRTQQRHLYG